MGSNRETAGRALLLGVLLVSASTGVVVAQERLSGSRYLRAVSVDLLGRAPTIEEYAQVDDGGDLPDALLEQWLSSEAFAQRVSRFHRQFRWNNTRNITLQDYDRGMSEVDGIWKSASRDQAYRGVHLPHIATCGDFEAVLDDQGRPVPPPDTGQGYVQEGWVWVRPYWDPDIPIKVCAFDAMEQTHSRGGLDCRSKIAKEDPDCGCGPHLNYCMRHQDEDVIGDSFDLQVERLIEKVVTEDRPYSDILETQSMMMNGPIVHYYRYKAHSPFNLDLHFPLLDYRQLPDLDFVDRDTWVEVNLPQAHSGILTSHSFLLRFMSNRARADRFNTSFMCSAFIGPPGGLPAGGDSATVPDLTQRDGCKYCHARLEPMAAHWGRWTKNGDSWLDPDTYPAFNDTCLGSNDPTCADFYVIGGLTAMEQEWQGWLKPYQFLKDRYHENVEIGPKLLVRRGLASGQIQACAVDQAVGYFLRRDLGERDESWRRTVTERFITSGLSYQMLIEIIVRSERYRRLQ